MPQPRLSLLDLGVIPEGRTAPETVRAAIALARAAEEAGCHRFWLAEHHLTAGGALPNPVPVLAAIAGETTRIRLGSGATLTGHRTSASIAEDFALLAVLAPGRIDLGLGRSAARGRDWPPPAQAPRSAEAAQRSAGRIAALQQDGGRAPDHLGLTREILTYFADNHRDAEGLAWTVFPGGAEGIEVWSLGSAPGESARMAGTLGLPFAVNYHTRPATSQAAVADYRAALAAHHPGRAPRIAVSVELVLTDGPGGLEEAGKSRRALLEWVHRQRSGPELLPLFPAEGRAGIEADPLVADRAGSIFFGPARKVAAELQALAAGFGAEEVILTLPAPDFASRLATLRHFAKVWAETAALGAPLPAA